MPDVPENVQLPTGGWRLWEHFALRGPGFPADGVLELAPPGLAAAADKFDSDRRPSGPEWEGFVEAFDAAAVATAHRLREIAASPRFRAAVAWQNPTVLRTGIAPFLKWEPSAAGRTSMPRQREELVAHYWQRFCVKNDTIGFFGPVGWGRWDLSRHDAVTVDPGEGFLADSRVYFASWAIDALARSVGEDPRTRRWIPPRRISFVRLDDGRVRLPGRPPQEISEEDRAVLELCDGTRSVVAIADGLGVSEERVTGIVESLVKRRWVHWRLEVPSSSFPERALREILVRIGDRELREEALERLAVLERGRDAVQAAGTDAAPLTRALEALETDFAALTATEAQRAKGARTAPCRGLVYSDARRAARATLGTDLLDRLTPLGMCLTAARWMTNRVAEVVGGRLREEYRKLAAAGDGIVDLGTLWMSSLPSPHPRAGADIDAVQEELRAKWSRVLEVPEGVRRVRLDSADIADRVREEFEEPGAGWSLARYVSPDLLVLADDREAVERGEFELVLGEMHCALNTMGASLFVHQHPDREALVAETTRDFPGPRLLPLLPKELPLKWSARSRPSLDRPQDYHVALVDDTGDPHRPRTLRSADVAVEERDGEMIVVLPDGAVFPLLDVYANTLTQRVMDRFSLRPEGDHTPRITIDDMVVSRETWSFDAAELEFAEEKREAGRFVGARRWRREHDLPRFVFVVSPTEPRPFYVDFDSPVYVNILAKAARRLARREPGARLRISEMLPTPEQAWLTDDRGRVYTSELRFVAVDTTTPAADGDGGER
ncbi:hypothetical protein GCM10027160_32010 [Streptomyces calidiresistens]|uniref:Lantibiotic dehydratase n=1 Tax=Streptomyces calidiresistens TaxID=1485586 RepID=A0A7W3SZD5_9ACTN|nr:lantibiotic dehydratase [Streptomyces calidiresistens]MBB0228058.1 lantibiotic dehydratase [Streptomyces calidiresistens]